MCSANIKIPNNFTSPLTTFFRILFNWRSLAEKKVCLKKGEKKKERNTNFDFRGVMSITSDHLPFQFFQSIQWNHYTLGGLRLSKRRVSTLSSKNPSYITAKKLEELLIFLGAMFSVTSFLDKHKLNHFLKDLC